jgi:hypothetical protein
MRGGGSLNEQVVAWHLLEDVLVASVVLLFWDVPLLDPALFILITLFVLGNVIRNLRRTWGSATPPSRSSGKGRSACFRRSSEDPAGGALWGGGERRRKRWLIIDNRLSEKDG